MIALAGFVIYYHATENWVILANSTGGGRLWLVKLVLGYLGPLFAGGVVVLFMIKPLFSKSPKPPEPFRLKPEDEPLLFAFVNRICELVGSPKPKEIRIDNQVNASAAFRRGWISMLGSDLVLTIGLPLAAGIRSDQLAGILAHEFGHFAQALGMRFTYIIRSINIWFARIVFERDKFDFWLEEQQATAEHWMLTVVLWLASQAVNLSRLVLKALMKVGQWMSAFLSQQMELDADRYEARLAGSSTFAQTVLDLNMLNQAAVAGYSNLEDSWKESRLVDDFPSLVALKRRAISGEVENTFRLLIDEQEADPWSTHPIDKDRIASANAENSQGVFHVAAPASQLFANYENLSREVTAWYYTNQIGDKSSSAELIPFEDFQTRVSDSANAEENAVKYSAGILNWVAPPPLSEVAITGDPAGAMRGAAESFQSEAQQFAEDYHALTAAESDEESIWRHSVLRESGFGTELGQLRFVQPDDEFLHASLDNAEQQLKPIRARELSGNEALGRRLSTALSTLRSGALDSIEGVDKLRSDAEKFSKALSAYSKAAPSYDKLYRAFAGMDVLMQNIEGNEAHEGLLGRFSRFASECCDVAQELRAAFLDCEYPFRTAGDAIHLRDSVVPDIPSTTDLGASYQITSEIISRYQKTFFRIVGELVRIANTVEDALGVKPPAGGQSA